MPSSGVLQGDGRRRKTCFLATSLGGPTPGVIQEEEDGRRGSLESEEDGGETRQWTRPSQLKVKQADPIEGEFCLVKSKNYQAFLAAIGCGPLSANMVMRARVVLRIKQELDKQWSIGVETVVRAKSIRGYNTAAGKITHNKWQLGVENSELGEDWDQRDVTSTLTRDLDGMELTLEQKAAKNQKFNGDSTTVYSIEEDDQDILTMTASIGDVVAWRVFRRRTNGGLNEVHLLERKASCVF